MGYAIGTLQKNGGDDCHHQLLDILKTLAEANGWVTLRYDNTSAEREWIGQGQGLSGTEQIYIGYKTYQDAAADYYNLATATMIGFDALSPFEAQPGIKITAAPSHNNSLSYFYTANAQRIAGAQRIGSGYYSHSYNGKAFKMGLPTDPLNDLVCAAMYNNKAAARFSVGGVFPYYGLIDPATRCFLRAVDGSWQRYRHYPFSNGDSLNNCLASGGTRGTLVPAGDNYQIEPIIIQEFSTTFEPKNIWCQLDGVGFVSGFNNSSENIIQEGGTAVDITGLSASAAVQAILNAGGRAYIVLQSGTQSNINSYIALECT